MTLLSFELNDERDLFFDGRQRLRMVSGLEARKQRIRLRLGTHLQEWFLDTMLGVPWLKLVEKGTSKALIRAEIIKALSRDGEVERVLELTIGEIDEKRRLPIEFSVLLVDGSTLVDAVGVNL